ncbi:MAG: hypothetical protein ACW98D_16345 [Promethearchaeota archaeon]
MGEKNEFIEAPGYGLKRRDLRRWWNNVAQEPDEEILVIDKLEDELEFNSNQDKNLAYAIREAIGGLEGCHFKVEHRINRIIYAIRNSHFPQSNQRESVQLNEGWYRKWDLILNYLEKWSSLNLETPSSKQEFINGINSEEINEILGEKTTLKAFQVNFVIESIHELLKLWFMKQASSNKKWEEQTIIIKEIQIKYEKKNPGFWEKTSNLFIPIKEKNHLVSISELLDTYEYIVCISNPNFMNDLLSILGAIGGNDKFVHNTCAFYLDSLKEFVGSLSTKLKKFLKEYNNEISENDEIMELFGEKTPIKFWLVASLDKTIKFWN